MNSFSVMNRCEKAVYATKVSVKTLITVTPVTFFLESNDKYTLMSLAI